MAKNKATQMRHEDFVRRFCAGEEYERGNATRAYMGAYPKCPYESARRLASQLLSDVDIVAAIKIFHAQATAQSIAKLKSWKEMAVKAQALVDSLIDFDMPMMEIHTESGVVIRKKDSGAANVALRAALAVIDRAYPRIQKTQAVSQDDDPVTELARLAGVPPETMPPS